MTFNSILSPVTYLKDILVIRIHVHIYSFFPSNVLLITDKISFRQFIRVVVTQTLIMLAWLNVHDHEGDSIASLKKRAHKRDCLIHVSVPYIY